MRGTNGTLRARDSECTCDHYPKVEQVPPHPTTAQQGCEGAPLSFDGSLINEYRGF